jgi:Mn2+/Fe2+ NRAMP family transporter
MPFREKLIEAPDQAESAFRRIRLDTVAGMIFSNIIALAIMITTAATLGANHVTNIETSAQAAEALRPIAGSYATWIFALGIIGTGLLAIPVLAGSAAYAMAETLRWRQGLALQWFEAKYFYATLAMATLIGMGLNFTPIDPIRALFWSAVINGVVAVPVMVLMMRLAANSDVMGELVVAGRLKTVGWAATWIMGFASVAMVAGFLV